MSNQSTRFTILLLVCASLQLAHAIPLDLLKQQAADGNATAQYELGERLYEARGVPRDVPGAKQWIEKAAARGNAKAQYRLASMQFTGVGMKKDAEASRKKFKECLPALEKLAKEGDADAQGKMGVLHVLGVGVERDDTKAVEYFQLAAGAGHAKSQEDLAQAYLSGRALPRNPTLAGEWFEKAAQAGLGRAQIQLAILYVQGQGRRQDIPAGLKWLETASTTGHPAHAAQAKDLLMRLKKNPPSKGPDIDALIKQAEAGDLAVQKKLALRFQAGDGVRLDLAKAASLLHRAVQQGDAEASYQLGGYFVIGRHIPKDMAQAARYWRVAAWLGHPAAQVDFAVMCAKGDGLPKNLREAYHWMLIARRSDQTPRRQQILRTLQSAISKDLDPDLIINGLTNSANFAVPADAAARAALVKAASGDSAAQLVRGKMLAAKFPVEAAVWLRLAAQAKEAGAADADKAMTAKLSKLEAAEVEARVKSFKSLGDQPDIKKEK